MNTTKILALRKPLLISAWLLAMQGATYAQNPIVQTQLTTDPKQYELLEMSRISGFVDRARGTGRPTKKERRALDAFVDPAMFGFDEEDWDEDEE